MNHWIITVVPWQVQQYYFILRCYLKMEISRIFFNFLSQFFCSLRFIFWGESFNISKDKIIVSKLPWKWLPGPFYRTTIWLIKSAWAGAWCFLLLSCVWRHCSGESLEHVHAPACGLFLLSCDWIHCCGKFGCMGSSMRLFFVVLWLNTVAGHWVLMGVWVHGLEHEGVFCSLVIEHTTVWRLWGQWVFMDVLM